MGQSRCDFAISGICPLSGSSREALAMKTTRLKEKLAEESAQCKGTEYGGGDNECNNVVRINLSAHC
jgi:hypothetical protein